VPDTRAHRGPDPRDGAAFDSARVPALREAVGHLSWLLSHDYAPSSALKLVGDRFSLTERQRMAVMRCSCADWSRARRLRHRVTAESLRGGSIALDGFNVLTTVEAAFGGAVVLVGRDGSFRDLAGVHGTYRKVEETRPAVRLVGAVLAELGVSGVRWLLDSPVSNSGRLRALLLDEAGQNQWDWQVELSFNPDPVLSESTEVVATADSAILDRCARWFPLARIAIERRLPSAWLVDLSGGSSAAE
jgi:hypothetical protein